MRAHLPHRDADRVGKVMRKAVYDKRAPDGVRVTRSIQPNHCRRSLLIQVRAAGINPVDAKHVIGDKLPICMSGWVMV